MLANKANAVIQQATASTSSMAMLRTPVFWLLYVMFLGVSASGLMATAQLGLIAKDYGISDTMIFLGASTLSVALVVDNVLNGLARPSLAAFPTELVEKILWPWPSRSVLSATGCLL